MRAVLNIMEITERQLNELETEANHICALAKALHAKIQIIKMGNQPLGGKYKQGFKQNVIQIPVKVIS